MILAKGEVLSSASLREFDSHLMEQSLLPGAVENFRTLTWIPLPKLTQQIHGITAGIWKELGPVCCRCVLKA